jgi:hypothetical protein
VRLGRQNRLLRLASGGPAEAALSMMRDVHSRCAPWDFGPVCILRGRLIRKFMRLCSVVNEAPLCYDIARGISR